jgi:hypothetical protein
VWFRNGQGEAVLNLQKVKTPTLNIIQGLYFQGSTEFLGDSVLLVAEGPTVQSDANDTDYQVVDISNLLHPNSMTDIKQVLEKITNDETGTTSCVIICGILAASRDPSGTLRAQPFTVAADGVR